MPQTQHKLTIENLLENPVFINKTPAKGTVANIAGVNFIKLTIKAGETFPSHHVNKSAFAVLLKGKAQFPIYDQPYFITEGAFLEIPKDAEHSVIAEEDSIFLVGIIGSTPEEDAC